MRKTAAFLLVVVLALGLSLGTLAEDTMGVNIEELEWVETLEYEGHTLRFFALQDPPEEALDLQDGMRAVGVTVSYTGGTISVNSLDDALRIMGAFQLVDADAAAYECVFSSQVYQDKLFTFVYAVPEALSLEGAYLLHDGQAMLCELPSA